MSDTVIPGKGPRHGSLRIAVVTEGASGIKLLLIGKVGGASLGEVRREIERARRVGKSVAIDLSEVTLMDRQSLDFLVEQDGGDVSLINCPEYIEPWIARQRSYAPGE